MPKTRRRRAARNQFWRDTVAAWQESGQAVRVFCAARGVSEATFLVRRRELATGNRPNVPAAQCRSPSSFQSKSFLTRR
jgi:hypothetical protein